jgi:hypothetical protein
MEIKQIVVCGDSFMCLDKNHLGTHFSELLDDRYSVTNLARAGVSNIEIGFQLKRAIELQPDYVMIGFTESDRIELPISNTDKIKSLQLEHFRPGNERYYLSSNIQTLATARERNHGEMGLYLTDEKTNAVKQYLSHIYDHTLMKEVDSWIIGYWLIQLKINTIPCYVFDRTFAVYNLMEFGIADPIYHTDYATQIIAAEWVDAYLGSIFNH